VRSYTTLLGRPTTTPIRNRGMMKLQAKVAVVAGGASGIGRGTVLALAGAGADPVIADINQKRMDDVVDAVKGLAQGCDVTSDDDVDAVTSRASSNATSR
jgi:NAD(P)-dependent dehydrogenase (short-subunit alcohol dehydrogenase family)